MIIKTTRSNTNRKIKLDELLFTVAIISFITWYLYDTFRASADVENLIFIFPVGIASLLFGVYILVKNCFTAQAEKHALSNSQTKLVIVSMVLFSLFCLSLDVVGFDFATAIFIGSLLYVQGERRIKALIIYPILFAFLASLFFEFMLPYPMTMLFGKAVFGM